MELLSVKQVKEVTSLGKTYIYELINTGRLPAKKIGKRTVILKSDLEAFIESLSDYSKGGI